MRIALYLCIARAKAMMAPQPQSIRSLVVGAVFGVVSTTVASAGWSKEPREVMGMRLGAPISESGIAECDQKLVDQPFCYSILDGVEGVVLSNAPIKMLYDGQAFLSDGKVIAMAFTVPRGRFDDIASMLARRYGPPHKTSTRTVTSMSGVRLSARKQSWNGVRTSITLDEAHKTITDGVLIFMDIATSMQQSTNDERAAEDEASKL